MMLFLKHTNNTTPATRCIVGGDNTALMERLDRTQVSTIVSDIYFFQDPTFLMKFKILDVEEILFDMMVAYLFH